MRRIAAIILLLPLATLFLSAMRIATVCPPDQSCYPAPPPNTCLEAKCAGCQKTGHHDKQDRQPCCFNCPLCALVTLSPFIEFELTPGASTIEYAVMPVNNLTDYYQHHWKPPDRDLPS